MGTKYVITHCKEHCISALFHNDVCQELHVLNETGLTGRIYVGRVENVVKNLNCAFVEIEKGLKCYYSLADNQNHIFLNRKNTSQVNSGDFLLVQISREALKTKPAAATCKLSLTGEYVVLSADVTGVQISGKTKGSSHCRMLKEKLTELFFREQDNPSFGFILRTNSSEAETAVVLAEAQNLAQQYVQIRKQAAFSKALTLLYQPHPPYVEALKNLRLTELEEIVTDDITIYNHVVENADAAVKGHIRFYDDALLPLYKLYALETIIERALHKKVWLKSGGYLVIEQTEALTVIDVNSGKMIQKRDSYLKTNLEAAVEIARQLRLRNLSGMIIIDFINMKERSEQEQLITVLKEALRSDSAGADYIDLTKLGLVELTRRKKGKSLQEAWEGTDG